jgi:hypothetical protein
MPFPEATQVLLRRAILPDSEAIRNAAADELKKRPMHAYVPQLIASIPSSLKTKFHVVLLPGGMVMHEHEVLIEGRAEDVSLRYLSSSGVAGKMPFNVTSAAFAREIASANAIEAAVRKESFQLDGLRRRVEEVLKYTTGFSDVSDPQLLEKQYSDYNEWYTRPYTKGRSVREVSTYQFSMADPGYYIKPGVFASSCFPAGTTIMTADGPRPIEQLRIGDRVLSQDVESGELALNPVQATTWRPPVALIRITSGSTSVLATRGHPFWANGEGWRLAKQLKVGQTLHGLHGALRIDSIEESSAKPAYNVVVGNLATYFVGEDAVLVHDNTPLPETSSRVPGLHAEGGLH